MKHKKKEHNNLTEESFVIDTRLVQGLWTAALIAV